MRLEPFSALFFRMGVASAGPDDRRPAGFVYSARGVTRLAFGRWREAYALLEEALLCCKDHAEPQLAETAHTLIGLGLHFEGRWQEALARFDKVRALAAARDHLMHQGWADYATAQTLMALDRVAEAEPLLARAEDCLSNVADAQSHLICRGLRIQAHWRLGRVDRALELCGRAASDPTPPTNFGSLEGYAAPAHVAAQALAASPSDRDLYWLAMGAVKRLKSYALVFPIGRPRLSVVKAYLALPSSRPRAARHAACALDQALSLSMADERRFAQDAMQAATRS
jgi:tetratricopeptide (TPR) repeat protein